MERRLGIKSAVPASSGYGRTVRTVRKRKHCHAVTGLYTVLVDSDEFNEPLAEAMRSINAGHIGSAPHLADQGHFPATDVLRSISRLRSDICPREDVLAAG